MSPKNFKRRWKIQHNSKKPVKVQCLMSPAVPIHSTISFQEDLIWWDDPFKFNIIHGESNTYKEQKGS